MNKYDFFYVRKPGKKKRPVLQELERRYAVDCSEGRDKGDR